MFVSFDEPELRELEDILRLHLQGLLREIVHTDNREYRSELRQRYERLEAMQRRFAEAASRPRPRSGR